ncbi:MAG TPA: maleylpyruvate isomerase family mycothiol-dependent enzyme [Acidothermaceae bacterium]|nr:maleylpyruvate isomerase family mycothiol-dependent enzyme [Acidothermaceae bacterium]
MSEHWDPAPDSVEIEAATSRLLATAKKLSDADVRAPSGLPGWSRGHVLTHVARNADSLVNLLTSATTGVEYPQYPSREARDAGIEAGAGRSAAEQLADIEASHQLFMDAVTAVPAGSWQREVRWMSGELRPASKVLDARLREVAIHHIDLDASYTASDWPSQFALRILGSVLPALEVRGIEPVTLIPSDIDVRIDLSGGSAVEVRGPASALATWVLGRDDGSTLAVTGGQLPTPPAWT